MAQLNKLGQEFVEFELRKKNLEKANQDKAKADNIILDSIVKITHRRACDLGCEDSLNFYGGEYERYFANYVRLLRGKLVSDQKAIALLNEDLLKNVGGNFFESTKKARNIQLAYINFKNACASVEIQLARENGIDNYYEMATSLNPRTREVYKNFEAWQRSKDAEFKQMIKVDEGFMKYRTQSNPMNAIRQDGICLELGLGMIVFPAIFTMCGFVTADLKQLSQKACIGAGLGLGLFAGALLHGYESSNNYSEELSEIANKYGFKNGSALVEALQKNSYSYLTREEAINLGNSIAKSNQELVSQRAGYRSLDDALVDIAIHSSTVLKSQQEILETVATERTRANELFATQNGFSSYSDLVQYLNNHKILTGETSHVGFGGAGWSVYNYDNANAQQLSRSLTGLDEFYDQMTSKIKNGEALQEVDVYDNDEITNLMIDLGAIGRVSSCQIKYLLDQNKDDTIFYTQDVASIYAGNEALDLAEDCGKDVITTHAHRGISYCTGHGDEVVRKESHLTLENNLGSDSIDNASDTMVDALAGCGLAVGLGLSWVLRCQQQIKNGAKQRFVEHKSDELNEINNQVMQDSQNR